MSIKIRKLIASQSEKQKHYPLNLNLLLSIKNQHKKVLELETKQAQTEIIIHLTYQISKEVYWLSTKESTTTFLQDILKKIVLTSNENCHFCNKAHAVHAGFY